MANKKEVGLVDIVYDLTNKMTYAEAQLFEGTGSSKRPFVVSPAFFLKLLKCRRDNHKRVIAWRYFPERTKDHKYDPRRKYGWMYCLRVSAERANERTVFYQVDKYPDNLTGLNVWLDEDGEVVLTKRAVRRLQEDEPGKNQKPSEEKASPSEVM